MRLKLLLVSLLMVSGMLYAQDTIKTLVISEARTSEARYTYLELTNMGTETIDLHDFEVGKIGPWTDHYEPDANAFIKIGDYIDMYVPTADPMLGAGETFWISVAFDFAKERHIMDPLQYGPAPDLEEQWDADIVMHEYEAPSGPTDSISVNWQLMELWDGRSAWYVRNHFLNAAGEPDSVVIDQVGGVWDGADGDNGLGRNQDKAYDVAGLTDATNAANLVRKFTIKEGNTNFDAGRGLTLDDSEWMPIPFANNWTTWTQGRKMMWTVGNHGAYNLDEDKLTSSTIDVDWNNNVLNVPWGIHNRDSVMMQFDYSPGLAWHYQLAKDTVGGPNYAQSQIDSSYVSARTGDTLIIWACGEDLDEVKFHINLLPPTDDANVIVPRVMPDDEGFYDDWASPVFEVTNGVPGMDTILNVPFATRTDSILKYFEKAPEAAWEFVFASGTEMPDVRDGDYLRVTAKDGSVKDYYIDVMDYNPSHNADLLSITWPDIPGHYRNVYGYTGDTVPNFSPQLFSYKAIVPADVDGIPALLAKADDLNTKVEVARAVNLYGSTADQTVTFTSTAEDDTTILVYSVQLLKEKNGDDIQPWVGDPFMSEFVFQDQWTNSFYEFANPGTGPLDLSNYMFVSGGNVDPVSAVQSESGADNWISRYRRYVPGYKWVNEADWAVTPAVLEQDLNVDPIVQSGDVFVMGVHRGGGQAPEDWWVPAQMDIDFHNNPWGEEVGEIDAEGKFNGYYIGGTWVNGRYFLYEIIGDSIKEGLKAATDPEDFKLIEAWASTESEWVVGGRRANADNQIISYIRKPEIYKPNPEIAGSFGTQVDNGTKFGDGTSEWIQHDRNYGIIQGYNWPFDILYITTDLGVHFMYEVTEYMSTVSSLAYKVSQGYGMTEEIRGLVTGVTVSEFFASLSKKDDAQVLTVKSGGVALAADAVVSHGDSLVVVSANGLNTTKYHLEVTADGLSDNAVLTAETYTVAVDGATGTVSGFAYGTLLKTVVNDVILPSGASMDVIDGTGAYVSLKKLNYDTTYVETQVSNMIYFAVTAEDGETMITYQLTPDADAADAFVLSEIYTVDQATKLISLVPDGTAVAAFYKNLTPATGASIQVKDKLGFDRNLGNLYQDDKLVVTASDGTTQATYYLAMLDREILYLAYVVSDVYQVDQNAYTIVGVPAEDLNEKTLVSAFKANLTPASGASIAVLDMDMVEKTDDDDMDAGDILMATAGDGVTVNYYDVTVNISSARNMVESQISVYPNPSNGVVYVEGLEQGNRIQIFNSLGSSVLDRTVVNTTEMISIENQGFYFMTISNESGIVEVQKLIVE